VIKRLFREEYVDHHGRYFNRSGVGLGTRPIQAGGPPIYVAATVDRAIDRSARIADGVPLDIYLSLERLEQQVTLYRDARVTAGVRDPGDIIIMRECHIGSDNRLAMEECRGPLGTKYATYMEWEQDAILPEGDRFNRAIEALAQDRFLIGDCSFVRDEIARYRDVLGVESFVFRVGWPGLDVSKSIRTIRLLADEVLSLLALIAAWRGARLRRVRFSDTDNQDPDCRWPDWVPRMPKPLGWRDSGVKVIGGCCGTGPRAYQRRGPDGECINIELLNCRKAPGKQSAALTQIERQGEVQWAD
jgi:hypothetical protein